MNTKAINKLTYGVYIVTTKKGHKIDGCVINTCVQVGTTPDRIAISLMNSNYTRKIVKESGVFCISILDETCTYDLIKLFGYQSGRNVDKFVNTPSFNDINCVPCVIDHVCATISATVIDSINLGSHTIFIGKVNDSKLLNDKKPLTYDAYQSKVKPSSTDTEHLVENKITGWRCKICGYILDSPDLPEDFTCPQCGHPASDFEPIYGS